MNLLYKIILEEELRSILSDLSHEIIQPILLQEFMKDNLFFPFCVRYCALFCTPSAELLMPKYDGVILSLEEQTFSKSDQYDSSDAHTSNKSLLMLTCLLFRCVTGNESSLTFICSIWKCSLVLQVLGRLESGDARLILMKFKQSCENTCWLACRGIEGNLKELPAQRDGLL